MRSQRVRMTVEEFELLPYQAGWKCEYWDGRAHFTPRHTAVIVRAPIVVRVVKKVKTRLVRRVTPDDSPALIQVFYESFRRTVEYCDWEDATIYESAESAIRSYWKGKRGDPHPASFLSVAATNPATVTGAALVVQGHECPALDILFIRPRWQRKGLATALVSTAMNALFESGETVLNSAFDLANENSRVWHEKFGFVELPDLMLAQSRATAAGHELWRREKIGNLTEQERVALENECAMRESDVEELEAIAERDGFDAVSPVLRRRGRKNPTGDSSPD